LLREPVFVAQALNAMSAAKVAKRRRRDENCGKHTDRNEEVSPTLAESEAQDWDDLCEIAAEATVVEFGADGRPFRPPFLPADAFDPIQGIVKMRLPSDLLSEIAKIHDHIKRNVDLSKMVPWAGTGNDTTRLRAFGVLPNNSARFDQIHLHAPEKVGSEAEEDEKANREATCILRENTRAHDIANDLLKVLGPAGLPEDVCTSDELIVYQPNLHNGAQHLASHLDHPLYEGFGKVIVTIAMKGSATILLISGESEDQPAWRFHLNEGECYVLSDRARNRCLHAVLADDDEDGGKCTRESLNLRFGLHTPREAEQEILRFWPDEF
jgi:hypothetical protein